MTEIHNARFSNKSTGFSLIELLVTLGVLSIVSAIAIPLYTDYIETARLGVMSTNIETIRLFEEDYRLSESVYIAGTYDPADPDAAGGLKADLGWEPRTDGEPITYVVVLAGGGFTVTATDSRGEAVTQTYP
jgi:type IV pilus assembly protein PilE